MRRSYLGKIPLHWCDTCHVPVLGERCACDEHARPVQVTPPGDIRPAFQSDVDHVNDIFQEHFGAPLIPAGHLALLNKIPDQDRMEEVIIGGSVVTAIRYLPDEGCWEPIPRTAAMAYMTPKKRYIIVDDGAVPSIEAGASVLAPGLVEIEDSVRAGDEVYVLDRRGACVGVGRAKADASVARSMDRGVIVRTRKNAPNYAVPGPANWKEAVRANEHILNRVESEAVRFVRDVAEHNHLPVTVSYSGGKDSLATLLVVLKALGQIPLLFADTGLEFVETYKNVDLVASHFGLEVIRTYPDGTFQKVLEEQGPPAVDDRWCCKVLKLHPVREIIRQRFGECLSFIGQRKYESFSRSRSPRVWRNGFVQCQLSAAPIQHWTALHVWLYIFRESAPYNQLYEQRIDRIGCFLCPSSDRAVLATIQVDYPDLWNKWHADLCAWQEKHDLPDDWVTKGYWRRKEEGRNEERSYS